MHIGSAPRVALLTVVGFLGSAMASSCTPTSRASTSASGSAVFREAFDRLVHQRRFRLHGYFHWLSQPSPAANFDIRFQAPDRLWARYWENGEPGTRTRHIRASGQLLETMVEGLILPRGIQPTLDPSGGSPLHDVRYRVTDVTHLFTVVTITARGYPWICYPLYSACALPAAANERENSYAGVLQVARASGLPLRFTSSDIQWHTLIRNRQVMTMSAD